MPYIRWTERASLDLIRLFQFLASKSPEAARRALQQIRKSVRTLARYPETGRVVDAMPEGVRELVVNFGKGAYIVRYQVKDVTVLILAIRHGAEDAV